MAAFVKENGWWPTLGVLRSFCRDLSVMLGQDRPVANLRRDAAALLAAEAVPLPAEDKPPKDAKHRAYKLPVGGIPGAPPIERERQWGEQACIDALRRWSDRFPRTERLTEARYRAFAKGRPAFTCAQRVRAVWRLHQTARAGTGGKRAQVNQRSITIRIAVKWPAKLPTSLTCLTMAAWHEM
jgi:hypothetical protein